MRRLLRIVVSLVVLAALVLAGGGWYYSNQLLPPETPTDDPDRDLVVVGVTDDSVTVRPDDAPDWEVRDLGGDLVVGFETADGYLQLSGPPVSTDGDAVERRAELVAGIAPAPGDRGRTSVAAWPEDPSILGLEVEDVVAPGPLGDLPGWLYPGHGSAADDWVVYVHGRGGTRADALRTLDLVVGELGHSALVITHRNDVGAPPSPDGHGHFGDSEWADLEAWLVWLADTQEVETTTLFAFSQGASVVASCLRRCVDEVQVDAAVLDSPLLSLQATLQLQAAERSIPGPLIDPLLAATEVVTEARGGPEFDNLEHVSAMADLDLPILAVHGEQDRTVPIDTTLELAAADPEQVELVTYEGDHVRGWNVDPAAYEAAVAGFLPSG